MCWYSGCEYVRTPESEKSHYKPLGWVRSVPGVKDSAHLKQDLPASQCVGTLGVNMSAHLRVRKAIVGLSAGCALFQV